MSSLLEENMRRYGKWKYHFSCSCSLYRFINTILSYEGSASPDFKVAFSGPLILLFLCFPCLTVVGIHVLELDKGLIVW